jgi:hypothetical protein
VGVRKREDLGAAAISAGMSKRMVVALMELRKVEAGGRSLRLREI